MKIECRLMAPVNTWSREKGNHMSDVWNPTWAMFAACCGANYVQESTEKTRVYTGKGIRVFAGHVGAGKNTAKSEYNHINTKNGPLTIAVRTKV